MRLCSVLRCVFFEGGHLELTDVFLLEFTSQMAFDKSGLASTTVTNYALGQMSVNTNVAEQAGIVWRTKNELECGSVLLFSHD